MKNKTRTLTDDIKYRIGRTHFYVIIGGKRLNFPIAELKTERPKVSEAAEELYYFAVHHEDKDWFWFGDYGKEVEKECHLLSDWETTGPKSIRTFLYRKGLLA